MKYDKIELDILLNPLREKSIFQKSFSEKEIEEINSELKDQEEFNNKKKSFFYKEKILYNTLPNEHFQKINIDPSNLFSFENYFKPEEDFDCKNFENLMNMRKKYLETLFLYKAEEENKEKKEEGKKEEENSDKTEEKEEKEKNKDEKDKYENAYSLIDDLKEMIESFKTIENNGEIEDDTLLYFSIVEKIFSNIFFELETFYKKRDFNLLSKYEVKLSEIIDSFENIFLCEKNQKLVTNEKKIYILYQLQKISLTINSFNIFFKILRLMKRKKIIFDNYINIYKKYFEFNLCEALKENEEMSLNIFKITLNEGLTDIEFFIDEKYLYLCYNKNEKEEIHLAKYDIEKTEKIFEKKIKFADKMGMINDKQNNKIKLLLYQKDKNFELIIINKNDFSIEKEYKISSQKLSKNKEFIITQIMNSLNNFYIICKNKIFSLDLTENNFEFKLFLVYKENIPKNKSFYYILDDYIFLSETSYIDLKKKKFIGNIIEQNKEDKKIFFDSNKEIKYSLLAKRKKKEEEIEIRQTIYYKSKMLMITENNDLINILEQNTENILKQLKNDFKYKKNINNTNKEKTKFDPTNYYLNYDNNFDLILNPENEKEEYNYKIDEKLSNDYYEYLYNSLIKFYIYSSGKDLIAKDKLIMNINNDILFKEIKEIISEKNNNNYLLLYIYTYFLILYGKNKEINKTELDNQIKIIIDIVLNLQKEKPSKYLFNILRDIYKFKPEYMNDSYISENLLYKSDKFNLEEIIYNFSLISLENNKNFEVLLKNFLDIEKKIILKEGKDEPYDKKIYNEVCQNFLNYFLNKKMYQFNENDFWEKFEKIFIIIIEDYNSLLDEYIHFIVSSQKWLEVKKDTIFIGLIKGVLDKKANLLNDILNSVVCQSLFILINILFYQINSKTEKNKKRIIYILKSLIKTAYLTNICQEKQQVEKINQDSEEIIIINSNNLDLNKQFELLIPYNPIDKNLKTLYIEFDFETNYEHKLKIGKLPPLINCQSFFEIQELFRVHINENRIIQNNLKENDKKNNADKKLYQRFKLKFTNFNYEENNYYSNVLTNIRKSIISCVLAFNLEGNIKPKKNEHINLDNAEIEKKINDKKIKSIISNEFFNNISIIDIEENSINISNKSDKYLTFNYKDISNNKNNINIQKEYEILCKDINSIFNEENMEQNSININTNIKSFNTILSKDESHKKLIEIIHQEFIKKNIWGTMSDSLLRNYIISCFAIIVSDYNLRNDFDDLVKLLEKDEKAVLENEKLKQFIMIYTKMNNLKKIFSKKKHEFSLTKEKNESEDELLKKYLDEMRLKLDFIMENKNIKNNNLNLKTQTIEESIIFLLDFISDEKVTKKIIIKKIEELNNKAEMKERNLDCLNKMLFISDKFKDIKDIISCINLILKNGKNKFKNYEKDLKGADINLIKNYKRQIYIFLTQIISRIKSANEQYDISYYLILFNSLFYPFNKNDKEFLYKSKLYEILLSPGNKFYSLLHDLNSKNYNNINMDNNNIFQINNESLLNKSFDLFKLLSFIAINDINEDENNKNIPLIKYVFDLIFEMFNKYINGIDKYKKEQIEINEILNEEKLNHFLMIFYRCLLNSKKAKIILEIIQKYYKNIFTVLFTLFLYSSTKNKILSIKIISLLLLDNEPYLNDSYMKDSYQNLKTDLKSRNILLYNLILSEKVNHIENIFIEFLFNLILLLQQNIDNSIKYLNGTENNFALSFIIIKTLQKKLKKNDNTKIWKEIYNFIELNYMNKKYISIILQILGVEFDYIYIGSNLKFLQKEEKGIIIGFSNAIINEEEIQQEFNYKTLNYSKGRNLCYINEEDIANSDCFKNHDFSLDIVRDYINDQNVKLNENYKLTLPKDKNEFIYKNLLKNISNFEQKDIYLILKYIKLILLQEKIILDEETITLLTNKSLDNEVLDFHCKIINMEKLEKLVINNLCEINKNILEDIEEKKPVKEELNIDTKSEYVVPPVPDILITKTSLFYRFGEDYNLGYNINYNKVLNYNIFNESNKFLKLFDTESKCKGYKNNCILLTRDILNIKKVSPNIKYIIIPEPKNEEEISNIKIMTTPIIILETLDFKNIFEYTFQDASFQEAENLFGKFYEFDISELIDIPIEKIAEFTENQRDILLEILNIEPIYAEIKKDYNENEQNNDSISDEEDSEKKEEKNENNLNKDIYKIIFCGKSKEEIDINLIFKKLISQISRRMLIISKIIQKIKIEPKNLKNIIKLLNYETLTENNLLVENKNYEIHRIIKNFVIQTSLNSEYEIIKEFIDLSFLESDKLINDNSARNKETEKELLECENLNNNILLINMFFITENAKEKNRYELLDKKFLFEYISHLIIQDLNLVISFLVKIFKHIEKNIDQYIDIIKQNKDLFNCEEFNEMFNECENLIKDRLNLDNDNDNKKFNENTYEKIELIFSFFNINCILKYKYGINLDISYLNNIENSSLLSVHIILSILLNLGDNDKNNLEINYYNFVELCYQKSLYKFLINNEQFTKPLQTYKFNYYDKNFDSNFVMNYQNIIPKEIEKNIHNISLKLKSVDNNIINKDNCVFIYESEKCEHLQDYIKIKDQINDKRINLISPNFTISFPYTNFQCYLYGSGSNEKNSLGIQDNTGEKYFWEPHICVGLEDCKNIVDFKFGYYHTFVQSADQNLYTCGCDKGSSFKFETEFNYFNKQTYFQSLSKENEGIKLIAANNFNSSILLTNNNKLFCCGKNNTYCLGKAIKEEGREIEVPKLMPEFLPLIKEIDYPYIIKEIACGYKSTLFLLEAGYAFTCGSQDFKQCGSKEKIPFCEEYFPLYPPRGTKFTHVVAGEEFFLLLVEEIKDCGYGKLYSLGQNEFGRSGAGELYTNYTLQRLENVEDKDFFVISSRNENAAAISTEGILYTFGNNSSCALGLGDEKNRYIPTKVTTLEEYYFCDNVGISQNHMVVIAREKNSGKRIVLTCGDNRNKALCKNNNEKNKFDIPTEIQFFKEKKPEEEPIQTCLSRFQTYLMSIKVDLKENINKIWTEFKCAKCNKEIQYNLYFDFKKNNNIIYYCQECAIANDKNIFFVLNTINNDTKKNIEQILKEKCLNDITEINFEKNENKYICKHCNKEIINDLYQSYSNENLILCNKCFMSKCSLIEYPQLFLSYNKNIKPKISKRYDELNKILYPNIIKTEKPFLEFDLVANYKKEYIIKELYQNKELRKIFDNSWKMINENILVEMRKLKEFYEDNKFEYLFETKKEKKEEKEENKENKEEEKEKNEIKDESNDIKEEKSEESDIEIKKIKEEKEEKIETKEERMKLMEGKNYEYLANIAGKSNKYFLYEILQKLLEIRNTTNIKNADFPNLDLYTKNPTFYSLVFSLSNFINYHILKILSLSIKFPFSNNIFNKVLESSLKLVTSQERKEIFLKNIDKSRTEVNFENEEISISRIKANVFYKKNILDNDLNYTVFSQLFRQTRNYPQKNYLCKKDNRLFKIRLIGEGATDFSGVYNEVISIISFELESNYLDLLIKTPNNKNEIGSLRDKYMPNPKARGKTKNDMFYFLGNLMLHAICSRNVLNLNLHPIFYKKLLNQEIDFNEIETLDKLNYKFICNLENIKTEEEFNNTHEDLYFVVHSSGDNSLIELVENGQYKKVTFDNLSEFINLYKKFLLTEYDNQISLIRAGIFDILNKISKKNISYLITSQDLEEFITGIPKLDIQLLRENTLYESYEANSKTILDFWKALESFNEEEKSLYLKFVSGRARLPDIRGINYLHKIQKLNKRNPDNYMPTSTTCYFTLSLPPYSSYEILRDKLRYAIHNCSSIDADFVPDEGADEFDDQI